MAILLSGDTWNMVRITPIPQLVWGLSILELLFSTSTAVSVSASIIKKYAVYDLYQTCYTACHLLPGTVFRAINFELTRRVASIVRMRRFAFRDSRMATPTSAATCKCSNLFKDPRMLPCLHTFCLQCLFKASEIQGDKEALKCPTCDEKVPLPKGGIDHLPLDLHKAHEAEIALYGQKLETGTEPCGICFRTDSGLAVAFCVNCCDFLCKVCEEHHRSAHKSYKHEIVTVGGTSKNEKGSSAGKIRKPPIPCSIHDDEVLKFYCEQCEKLICRDCMELEHNDHRSKCNRVEAVAAKAIEHLKLHLSESESALASLNDVITQCKETMEQVESRKKEIDNIINSSLNQVRETLLAKNEEIRLGKITSLRMQICGLEKMRDDLSVVSDMIKVAESHTPSQQLSTKKTILERLMQLLQGYYDNGSVPLESTLFVTKIADPDVISQMVALGEISSGSDAASSTCDVGYVPRAVVGKERTIKVTTRNNDGEPFLHGNEVVTAHLRLMGSKESHIHCKSTSNGDGTYSLSFTAQLAGEHELHVNVRGNPIRGSPFVLTARQPRISYGILSQQKPVYPYSGPWDVAFTENGTLAVAEYGYHTVSLYSIEGTRLHTFGIEDGSGSGDDEFSHPSGVAINGDVMYVAENNNHRVKKLRISDKTFISKFGTYGTADGQFNDPRGICIDPQGKVFVADFSNHRIQIYQPDGTFAYSIKADPNNEESAFKSPWGIAFDPQGRLHIAAYSSHCIKIYTPEGVYMDSYGRGTITHPAGIAIDEEGYIAITQYASSGRLWIYNPDHTQSVPPIQSLSYPVGVTCDAEGMFWVAEYGNYRVHKY